MSGASWSAMVAIIGLFVLASVPHGIGGIFIISEIL